MSKQTWRKFTSAFKARVALEGIKNQQTLAELGKKFDFSLIIISKWKSEFLDKLSGMFNHPGSSSDDLMMVKHSIRRSFTQIEQLKVENYLFEKSLSPNGEMRCRAGYAVPVCCLSAGHVITLSQPKFQLLLLLFSCCNLGNWHWFSAESLPYFNKNSTGVL